MAKYRNLLRALLHEGRTEGLFALARLGGDPLSLDLEGLNLVTASVLAAVPQDDKLGLVRRVGDLVPDPLYGGLFTRPFSFLHPHEARAHAASQDVYDLLFPALGLDLGRGVLDYALGRGLSPGAQDLVRLRSGAAAIGPKNK